MRIGIIGYGKMGREIENVSCDRNHTVNLIIDKHNPDDLSNENLKTVDIAFEFTTPETAVNNIRKCFDGNTPVVSGTTGWLSEYDQIAEYCLKENQAMFYASNYSLGVNILFHLNNYLATVMNEHSEYDVGIEEIHHIQKLDAPSGTAIRLADDIVGRIDRKKRWIKDGKAGKDTFRIHSVREDRVPGTHIITYNSIYDILEIRHTAKSREGFALGAVLAAEFLIGKTGIFGMEDLLSP